MKKIISALLCVIMLLTSLSMLVYAREESNLTLNQTFVKDNWYSLGDVNQDDSLNAVDLYSIKANVIGVDGYESICVDAADINADGKVSSVDAFYLKSVVAGVNKIKSFENGYQVYSFKIDGVDISEYVVVLPNGTTYDDNIYFAYELLMKYTEKATGVTLPKEYGSTTSEHAIYFNDVTGTDLGDELGNDGFKYSVNNGNLFIYGTMRGNMYAAYDILEDYLGFLFYDNLYTLSSKVRTAEIEGNTENIEIAGFNYRTVYSTAWGSSTERTSFARHLNGSTHAGYSGTSYAGYYLGPVFNHAHSYWYYLPMGRGEMPEEGTLNSDGTVMTLAQRYYQKFVNGGGLTSSDATASQPCATDDAVFDTLYNGMLDTVAMCKARGYELLIEEGLDTVSFSINDGNDYCACKRCRMIANGGTVTRISAETEAKFRSWYTGEYEYDSAKKTMTFQAEGYNALYVALASRAADRFQEDYEGGRLITIIYGCKLPATIKPSSHLVLWYCGAISACANHHYGENKCNIVGAVRDDPLFHSDMDDETAMDCWVKLAEEVGTEVWYWMYPESYTYYLYDLPYYFDMYYDFQWLYQHGIKGVYYEGANQADGYNNFESLKAKLAAELQWNPTMSLDEYKTLMKKYIRAIYGEGYEHVYNYLVELSNANENIKVCVPYFSAGFDLYSKSYIAEHYEYMRNELLAAISEKGSIGYSCHTEIYKLLLNCEILGLSACYDSMYTNGSASSRSEYEARWTWAYNYMKNKNMNICVDPVYKVPTSLSFDSSPLVQCYNTEYRYKASAGYYSD